MIGFKPSVSLTHGGTTLHLRIDSSDIIVSAVVEGREDSELRELCKKLPDLSIDEARKLTPPGNSEQVFSSSFELLHAALDVFRGREFLYHECSPLICRCFGVRERDVVAFLNSSENPTLEALTLETSAGMGCRSCVPDLRRMLQVPDEKASRLYKNRPVAQWLEEIDGALKLFPRALPWDMHIEGMKGNAVTITFSAEAPQADVEETGRKLQGFLAGAVDPGLAFFLVRSRQR